MLYDSKNTEMTVQQAVKIMRGLRNWQNHVYEPHIIDQAIRVVVDTAESTLCNAHPFIGKYAIARCYAAGVHAGEVSSVNGKTLFLNTPIGYGIGIRKTVLLFLVLRKMVLLQGARLTQQILKFISLVFVN